MAVGVGEKVDKLPLNGLAVVGEIDQLKDHGSTDRVAPLIDETENVHGGAPLVQSPLTCGSGALSAAVNDFDTVLLAHEPPGALCAVSVSRTRRFGVVKLVSGTLHEPMLPSPVPAGPVATTVSFTSTRCHANKVAAACVELKIVVSVVRRSAALKTTALCAVSGCGALSVAANGLTA